MKASMVELMENFKTDRLAEERFRVIQARCRIVSTIHEEYIASRPPNDIVIPIGDIVSLPAFHSLIIETPLETTVTRDQFEEITSDLASLTKEWKEAADNTLGDRYAPAGMRVVMQDTPPLE